MVWLTTQDGQIELWPFDTCEKHRGTLSFRREYHQNCAQLGFRAMAIVLWTRARIRDVLPNDQLRETIAKMGRLNRGFFQAISEIARSARNFPTSSISCPDGERTWDWKEVENREEKENELFKDTHGRKNLHDEPSHVNLLVHPRQQQRLLLRVDRLLVSTLRLNGASGALALASSFFTEGSLSAPAISCFGWRAFSFEPSSSSAFISTSFASLASVPFAASDGVGAFPFLVEGKGNGSGDVEMRRKGLAQTPSENRPAARNSPWHMHDQTVLKGHWCSIMSPTNGNSFTPVKGSSDQEKKSEVHVIFALCPCQGLAQREAKQTKTKTLFISSFVFPCRVSFFLCFICFCFSFFIPLLLFLVFFISFILFLFLHSFFSSLSFDQTSKKQQKQKRQWKNKEKTTSQQEEDKEEKIIGGKPQKNRTPLPKVVLDHKIKSHTFCLVCLCEAQ